MYHYRKSCNGEHPSSQGRMSGHIVIIPINLFSFPITSSYWLTQTLHINFQYLDDEMHDQWTF